MAVKEFYVLSDKSIVLQVVSCEEDIVASMYPNNAVVQREEKSANVGWLYAEGNFWMPTSALKTGLAQFSKLGFRSLLTLDELNRFDGFEFDTDLSINQKNKLRTYVKNYDLLFTFTLQDTTVTDLLKYLVEVGILTSVRLDEINQRTFQK